jgi:ssDNA-binding Zn-finger/Zn-ribbon topoisomerase 1
MQMLEAYATLEAAKARKIAFCKRRGLPVPAFDKAEDFIIDDNAPCPKCGSTKGYMAEGTYTQLYSASGTPDGYILGYPKIKTVTCIYCGARIRSKKLWGED